MASKTTGTPSAASNKGLLIGAGLVAIAAAAAGTYFLYGSKNAKNNRAQVKAWTLKARGEVLERLEKLPAISEEVYSNIIKEVSARYQTLKKLDAKEVAAFASELQGHWKEIAKSVKTASKAPAKAIKAKKPVKK